MPHMSQNSCSIKIGWDGWVGNKSSDPQTLRDDIVSFKRSDPVPQVRLKLKDKDVCLDRGCEISQLFFSFQSR